MQDNILFRNIRWPLERENNLKKVLEFDEKKAMISIPITCEFKCNKISFYATSNLYFINFSGLLVLNFTENQNVTAEDVIADIKYMFQAVESESLQLVERSFLGARSYSIDGLDKARFARTKRLLDLLPETISLRTRKSRIKLL